MKHFNKKPDNNLSACNWIIRYILRCNIEQQIFLLYKLVGSDSLKNVKYPKAKSKLQLNQYENEVIEMLNQEEPFQPGHFQNLDKLVFIYVKYLVFLLAIDTIHSESLPVLHLLLKTKAPGELQTKLSKYQDDPKNNYLESCMLNESIKLGNVTLKIDPASFVQGLFEKDENGKDQDPFVLLTQWLIDQQNEDSTLKINSFVESYSNRFESKKKK